MALPRLRFSVRTLMIAVAVFALSLVVVVPAGHRLLWLYRTPPTTLALFTGRIDFVPVRSPIPVAQPAQVDCSYEVGLLPSVPSGLCYRVLVMVKLMDMPGGKVFDSHEKTSMLVSGHDSWKSEQGQFHCTLTPPGPGSYVVRYEAYLTDLFGRKEMVACHTGSLQVK